MQYPVSKPTGPWIFRAHVHQEPRCPGCAQFLQPSVVEFRDGWAWCQPCVMMRLHVEPWIPDVLESESMRDCSVTINGLRFYVPDNTLATAIAAYERYETLEGVKCVASCAWEGDGAYALTPAGESDLSTLDTSALERVQAELQGVRTRNSH